MRALRGRAFTVFKIKHGESETRLAYPFMNFFMNEILSMVRVKPTRYRPRQLFISHARQAASAPDKAMLVQTLRRVTGAYMQGLRASDYELGRA